MFGTVGTLEGVGAPNIINYEPSDFNVDPLFLWQVYIIDKQYQFVDSTTTVITKTKGEAVGKVAVGKFASDQYQIMCLKVGVVDD